MARLKCIFLVHETENNLRHELIFFKYLGIMSMEYMFRCIFAQFEAKEKC